jgi:hypothetical protein
MPIISHEPNADPALINDAARILNTLVAGDCVSLVQWLSEPQHPFEKMVFKEDLEFVVDYFDEKSSGRILLGSTAE